MTRTHALLRRLDERIALRVSAVIAKRPEWPCRRGCDACCRSLGEIPHATPAEWKRLREGVQTLPEPVRAKIQARIEALAVAADAQPIVCPFLDRTDGACRVYAHRLLACRAYGFFVSRGQGRWCGRIEEMPDAEKADVIFGNFDAVAEEAVRLLGPTVPLTTWWLEASDGPDAVSHSKVCAR